MFDRVLNTSLISVYFSYRKRLYFSILMDRAQEGAADEVEVLRKELDNLQKVIKTLAT